MTSILSNWRARRRERRERAYRQALDRAFWDAIFSARLDLSTQDQ